MLESGGLGRSKVTVACDRPLVYLLSVLSLCFTWCYHRIVNDLGLFQVENQSTLVAARDKNSLQSFKIAVRKQAMAERDREDQLKHHALAVQDMIRQLKGAAHSPARGSPPGRGVGGRGRSRGGPQPGGRRQPQKYQGQRGATPHHQQRGRTARQHRPYSHRHYNQRYGDEYDEYDDYGGYPEEYDIRHHQRHMYREYTPLEEEFDHKEEDPLTPESLVSHLLEFPEFSASLLQLMEQKNLRPITVRQITSGHPDIFCLNGEKVALKPKTSVCSDYVSDKGCESRSECKNFHICPNYVFGECSESSCFLGHSWNTNHNSKILQTLNLSSVPVSDLQKLLLSCKRSMKPKETLDVCLPYNSSGCKEENCSKLHVCLSFVVGNTKCHRKDCQLSHDILGRNCRNLLEDHGFSTNEAPRDITITLREANPSLADKLKSLEENKTSRQTSAKKYSQTKKKDTSVEMDFEVSKSKNKADSSSSEESGNERVKGKDGQESASSDSSSSEHSEDSVPFDKDRMKRNARNKTFVNGSSTSDNEDAVTYDKDKMKRNTRDRKSVVNSGSTSEDEDDVAYIKERIKRNVRKEKSPVNDSNTSEDEDSLLYIEERRKRNARKEKMLIDENTDSNDERVTHRREKYKKKNVKEKSSKNEGVRANDDLNTAGKKVSDKGMQRRTLWSHYLQGDITIPEICYYSVESMCRDEASVCPRLHATRHFHWQVSEQGNRWLNLRTAQVMAIEKAFCDVAQDGVDLPRLDPSTVDISVRGLLILMGRDTWHADFKSMTLTDSADTKKLLLRRLCTEAIQGQSIKASTYVWSFLDKNKKWINYGNVDTTGETNLVSSITSNDIEKSYLQNPMASVSFNNARFKYILDFKSMQQTNQKTNVSREVRRRPEHHLEEEEGKRAGEVGESGFPANWDLMQPEERMRLVQLTPSSQEYQTVINLLAGKLSTSMVMKIQRIQNPFLWKALQNKIKEMTAVYGDATKVDVRQVFHGTRHDVISSICVENFDWRLHGSSSGQMYGRGTYFSTDANYSYNYCQADSSGHKYMLVARVAVGAFTRGSSSMVRPPTNPVTNAPYDSTVDNVSNITILVKYDKQEYYPEYILTLT